MSIRAAVAQLFGVVAFLVAMLVLPQAAQAHAGHTHAMHAPAKAAPRVADVPSAVAQQVEQSLTAATQSKPGHVHDSSCDCGACAQCSCVSCFSAVAPMPPLVLPPSQGAAIGIAASRHRPGIDGPSLRRPPKSFA
jgi:hypothetical protein